MYGRRSIMACLHAAQLMCTVSPAVVRPGKLDIFVAVSLSGRMDLEPPEPKCSPTHRERARVMHSTTTLGLASGFYAHGR